MKHEGAFVNEATFRRGAVNTGAFFFVEEDGINEAKAPSK